MLKNPEHRLETIRDKRDLSVFDICSIDDLNIKDIDLILRLAREFRQIGNKKYSLLKDVTVFNAFFEDSTRTRSSFELAGKKLGADVINISSKDTSIKKKESLLDTAETLNAMRPEVIVVRTSKAGIPYFLSKHVNASILNAGDGWHEHPSQALLDALTMLDHHKTLKNKTVTIIGDILHSRVFGSLVRILMKLGAEIRIAAPATLIPQDLEKTFSCTVYYDVEKALKGVDVVYALRVQEERGASGYISTIREYSKSFGVSAKRFALADKKAILMHPGPVMRDIEVHSALVTMDQSRILNQVENGLAVRSALLWLCAKRIDNRHKKIKLI